LWVQVPLLANSFVIAKLRTLTILLDCVIMLGLANYRNSKKQGDVGLVLAIAWFETHGYSVSIPLTDSQDYDLVADMEDCLKKVQVRTSYHQKQENGAYIVSLRVIGGNRSGIDSRKYLIDTNVDYLFVVLENRAMYLIPKDAITNRRAITFYRGSPYEQYRVE
jgi:hypothetical protein